MLLCRPFVSNSLDFDQRLQRALQLIQEGELSHAARTLESYGLAPGNQDTLDELRNPLLRPPAPLVPPSFSFHIFESPSRITLDKQIFTEVLRSSRRGLNTGLSINRNEFLRLCLEDDVALDLLYDSCNQLARAEIPSCIVQALQYSLITAILKENGKIRGISAGDTFRRLTTKVLAR